MTYIYMNINIYNVFFIAVHKIILLFKPSKFDTEFTKFLVFNSQFKLLLKNM